MIHHIHVGKCAGSSINSALFQLEIDFKEYHCGDANKQIAELIDNDSDENIYLISTRDPMRRFISAFNWDKYEKIMLQNTENLHWQSIYEKFSSVNHLVESFESEDKELRRLAQYSISHSMLHMQLGISWYLPLALSKRLPGERVFVLNTESLLEDFNCFVRKVFPHKEKVTTMPVAKDSVDFLDKIDVTNPKFLSERAKVILKEKINEDYRVNDFLNSISA